MSGNGAVDRISRQFGSRFLRTYARWKLRVDPVYAAALDIIRDNPRPLIDLGCGIGLLAAYLRENGFTARIVGVDHDEPKIAAARVIARRYDSVEFMVGDIRDDYPQNGNVAALDILHYFSGPEQERIMSGIADAVAPGGVAIVRECLRDRSMRYRVTAAQERFARAFRWLRAERLNFPTLEQITGPFRRRGFAVQAVPMWGRTPFNNYLFVFKRLESGITNS